MTERRAGSLPARTRRLVLLLASVLLFEVAARALFAVYVKNMPPPNCGVQPLIFARLLYAYTGGRYASLGVRSGITVPDAHRGYRTAPGLKNKRLGGVVMQTNRVGARGAREYPVPKAPGVVRFVALGDSMTFGEGVADDATWPAQLERDMNVEVVNLGDRGYAHDQMYFTLLDGGLALQPDVVLLGYFDADVLRNDLAHYCYEKPRLVRGTTGWEFANVPVATPGELRTRYLMMPMLYAIPRALIDRFTEPPPSQQSGEQVARELFERMRQRSRAAGARFVLVYIPEHLEQPDDAQTFFSRYCRESASECINPLPEFRRVAGTTDPQALKQRFLLPANIHYNAAGYAVVAQAVRAYFANGAGGASPAAR